jgi:hypothetical protein
MLIKLTEEQCRAAIRDGDFAADIRGSSPTVVIVLTQSWCPEWTRMRPALEEFSGEAGSSCYYVEYDLEPFFDDFRAFKETTYRNESVPYLRYYREGVLKQEGNYADRSTFRRLLAKVGAA